MIQVDAAKETTMSTATVAMTTTATREILYR